MDMLYAVGLRAVLLFVCFALPYWCTCGTWWLYRTLCRPLTPEEAEAWVRGCRASAFNTFFVVPLLCVFLASITKEATARTKAMSLQPEAINILERLSFLILKACLLNLNF